MRMQMVRPTTKALQMKLNETKPNQTKLERMSGIPQQPQAGASCRL